MIINSISPFVEFCTQYLYNEVLELPSLYHTYIEPSTWNYYRIDEVKLNSELLVRVQADDTCADSLSLYLYKGKVLSVVVSGEVRILFFAKLSLMLDWGMNRHAPR